MAFRSATVARPDDHPKQPPVWAASSIVCGAGIFVFALFVSAVLEPKIRLLHALQALIYVATVALALRNNPFGFGSGFVVGGFWTYTNLFHTSFIVDGANQLLLAVRTGQIRRPDLIIGVIAAAGHFVLIAACLLAFLRLRPSLNSWGRFALGGALGMAYFALIIITTGPQYIPWLRRALHL
jgi:hypothetical protein